MEHHEKSEKKLENSTKEEVKESGHEKIMKKYRKGMKERPDKFDEANHKMDDIAARMQRLREEFAKDMDRINQESEKKLEEVKRMGRGGEDKEVI